MSGHDAKYFTTTKKGEIHELKEELNSQYKVPNQKLSPVAATPFFSTSPPHFFSTPSYSVFVFQSGLVPGSFWVYGGFAFLCYSLRGSSSWLLCCVVLCVCVFFGTLLILPLDSS
jgi:hypothetical protein